MWLALPLSRDASTRTIRGTIRAPSGALQTAFSGAICRGVEAAVAPSAAPAVRASTDASNTDDAGADGAPHTARHRTSSTGRVRRSSSHRLAAPRSLFARRKRSRSVQTASLTRVQGLGISSIGSSMRRVSACCGGAGVAR